MLAALRPSLCDRARMTDDSLEALKATIRKLFQPGEARTIHGEPDHPQTHRGGVPALRRPGGETRGSEEQIRHQTC